MVAEKKKMHHINTVEKAVKISTGNDSPSTAATDLTVTL